MNWQSIFLTSIASGVVSGVVAVVVVILKQFYDQRIEEQKAIYSRASWVHQRQVEILAKIYSCLFELQDYLRGATRAGRLLNEASPEKYLDELKKKSGIAVSEFINGKLIIPNDIADKCNTFFNLLIDAQTQLAIGKQSLLMGDGHGHAEKWEEAAKIAHSRIPLLLSEIEESARQIIHEESKSR
jgi:hypothetical protein